MDVREKLVELLNEVQETGVNEIPAGFGCTREYVKNEKVASHLIAHGVTVQDNTEISDELLKQLRNAPLTVLHEEPTIETVQEWFSVKEHLPQENEPEGKVCEQVQVLLINGAVSTGWCNRLTKMWWHLGYGETKFVGYEYDNTPVVAWQPLAQPPKGE